MEYQALDLRYQRLCIIEILGKSLERLSENKNVVAPNGSLRGIYPTISTCAPLAKSLRLPMNFSALTTNNRHPERVRL